jgi:predicted rRNA methylase YqxC with S4 and FtsJ domains
LLYEEYIKVFLASDPPNTRILDIGTGAGEFLRVCGEAGAEEVFGLDFSQTSLETSLRYGDADHFFI